MITQQDDTPRTFGPRVLVGVCTYNEAENITPLLSRIVAAVPSADVLVVDDDSPDGTAGLARQFASQHAAGDPAICSGTIRVLVREGQRGLGGAIRTAMRCAVEGGYDLFCNLDADLSHDPADLPRLIDEATGDRAPAAGSVTNPTPCTVNGAVSPGRDIDPAAGRTDVSSPDQSSPRVDVVIGSRYVRGGKIVGWPAHRRWMSGCLNRFTRRLLRLPVRDASGSFRCYHVETLADLPSRGTSSNGYAFLQEVLLDLHRAGAKCVEVPITFTDREAGQSKLGWREATRSATTVVRLLKRRSVRSA